MGIGNENEPKRFSDWVEVDCNECQRYWDNSCDGCKDTLKGSKTPCNSFLATRSVIIPQEIERLRKANNRRNIIALICSSIALLINIVMLILNW